MEIFFKKLLANICFAMLRFLDKVFGLFGILAGTEDISANGQEPTDIVSFFLNNSTLMKVFYWILLISVVLLAFFTIAGLIKNIVITKRAQSKTLFAAGGSVIAFFLVLIVLMGAITVSTQVLRLVNEGFEVNNELTLSQRIFDLSVEEGGWRVNDDDGTIYSAEDFSPDMRADKVFGKYETWFGFEKTPGAMEEVDDGNGGTKYESSYDTHEEGGIADLYKTNLLVLSLGSIIIFVVILKSVISLARRIFEILELFLLMPMSVSSIPLDDGSRFKLWRESMAAKVLSVFGTIVSLNLYILFLGIICDGINSATMADAWILQLVLMIGGALATSGSAALFSHLIGANQDPMQNLGQTIYSGMMVAQAGTGIGRMIFGGIFGRRGGAGGGAGGDGKRHGGLLRAAGNAVNNTGKLLGGNRYVDFTKNAGNGYQQLKNTLKGSFMKNGGIVGISREGLGKVTNAMSLMGDKAKTKVSDMIGLQDL